MKKLFLIRVLTVLILFSLCAFTGCGSIDMRKFNAKIVNTGLTFKGYFLNANRIYNAYYRNENWDPEDVSSKEFLWEGDETSPKYRTYIITEKVQIDEVFSVFPDIDFKKEMVVMYAYRSIYNGRQQKIRSIELDNKNLKIEFKYEKRRLGVMDASMALCRFLVVRMDKLNIEAVEFKLLNPDG